MNLPRAAWALARDFTGFAGWRRSTLAAALMTAGALAEGLSLALIVPLVALIGNPAGPRWQPVLGQMCARAGLCERSAVLTGLLAVFILAFALRAVLLAARDLVVTSLESAFVEHHRLALVRALAGSRWEDLADLRHARITFLLAAEVTRLSVAVRQLSSMAMAGVMLVGQWVLLALIAPPLAALFAVVAALGLALSLPSWRRATEVSQDIRGGQMTIVNLAQQLLGGLKLALAQGLQHAFVAEMADVSAAILKRSRQHEWRMARARVGSAIAAATGLAAMAWIGARGQVPLAALVAGIAVFVRMLGPGATLLRAVRTLAQQLPAHGELVAMEQALAGSAVPVAAIPADAPPLRGDVRFDEVKFIRPDGAVRFDRLDLTLPTGSRIGIIGPSGSGKTTFVDLLCALLTPQAGRILVDGQVLDSGLLPRWRAGIAYVAQDSYLFNDSLRRNLTWGLPQVREAEIAAALELAEADQVVAALPQGLDQPVGERGVRLSGGERQRLALARALIRRPRVLVLDEATNALDLPSEARILARIAELDWNPTVLIVAHRPEALAHCTRILRFEGGQLIADEDQA